MGETMRDTRPVGVIRPRIVPFDPAVEAVVLESGGRGAGVGGFGGQTRGEGGDISWAVIFRADQQAASVQDLFYPRNLRIGYLPEREAVW
jgi:hypothetical protein